MKSKLISLFLLYTATLLIGSLFAQTSDCPPCTKDQPASPGKACCGSSEYDPETHECCGNKIVEKGKCCRKGSNPTEYDPNNTCCENAGVLPKTPISNLDDCPNKRANPTYNPWAHVNGCSAPINVDRAFNADFTPACNTHDACYGTCGNNKGGCDDSFYTGMMNICDRTFGTSSILSNCKIVGAAYYWAVVSFGGSYFNGGQKEGCKCCP